MSDLAAPFLAVFPAGEDALAFWAFEALMQRAARNFRSDEQGIQCAPLLPCVCAPQFKCFACLHAC